MRKFVHRKNDWIHKNFRAIPKSFFVIKNVYIFFKNQNISKYIPTYFIFLIILSYCRNILKISSTVKINSSQIYERCLSAKIYSPRYASKIHPRNYISTKEASFIVIVITLTYMKIGILRECKN